MTFNCCNWRKLSGSTWKPCQGAACTWRVLSFLKTSAIILNIIVNVIRFFYCRWKQYGTYRNNTCGHRELIWDDRSVNVDAEKIKKHLEIKSGTFCRRNEAVAWRRVASNRPLTALYCNGRNGWVQRGHTGCLRPVFCRQRDAVTR